MIQEGFPSAVISKHKQTIKENVMEIGAPGTLDEVHNIEEVFTLEVDRPLGETSTHPVVRLGTLRNGQMRENYLSRIDEKLLPSENECHSSELSLLGNEDQPILEQ